MKKSHGFSVLEFILFLLIVGILTFLAIPFLRSLCFFPTVEQDHNKLSAESTFDLNVSAFPTHTLESNHSE